VKIYKIFICLFFIILLSFSPVLADDENFEYLSDLSTIQSSNSENITEPTINSRAAIVYERSSGKILYGKEENEKRKMASTTKIMTAIVVLENTNLDDIVTISSKAAGTGGSRLGLHKDDKISIQDLLYGLLLCSGNDAAVALAEHVSGDLSNFANMMNSKATSLGLSSTHFVTPHGLDDDNHYTTAYELALITNYALKNDVFANLVKTKTYTISINNHPKTLSNTNELLGNLDGVYGVKTGFTNGANRCLVTAVKRDNMDIICIVLGADTKKDRTKDSINLINYSFNNFKMVHIKEKITNEFVNWKICNSSSFRVEKGVSDSVDIIIQDIPYDFFPIKCNQTDDMSIYIYCNTELTAPLPSGSTLGYLAVSVNNQTVLTLNLYNSNSIALKSPTKFFNSFLKNYSYYLESIFY
jgi:serine-type D-ala-D-ala carboxypeptidase